MMTAVDVKMSNRTAIFIRKAIAKYLPQLKEIEPVRNNMRKFHPICTKIFHSFETYQHTFLKPYTGIDSDFFFEVVMETEERKYFKKIIDKAELPQFINEIEELISAMEEFDAFIANKYNV